MGDLPTLLQIEQFQEMDIYSHHESQWNNFKAFNSLRPSDAIWCNRFRSSLVMVMAITWDYDDLHQLNNQEHISMKFYTKMHTFTFKKIRF